MKTAIAATYILRNLCYWAIPMMFDTRKSREISAHYTVARLDRPLWSTRNRHHITVLRNAIRETGKTEWSKTLAYYWIRDALEAG
jgi:hypothetical protein